MGDLQLQSGVLKSQQAKQSQAAEVAAEATSKHNKGGCARGLGNSGAGKL